MKCIKLFGKDFPVKNIIAILITAAFIVFSFLRPTDNPIKDAFFLILGYYFAKTTSNDDNRKINGSNSM